VFPLLGERIVACTMLMRAHSQNNNEFNQDRRRYLKQVLALVVFFALAMSVSGEVQFVRDGEPVERFLTADSRSYLEAQRIRCLKAHSISKVNHENSSLSYTLVNFAKERREQSTTVNLRPQRSLNCRRSNETHFSINLHNRCAMFS